MLLVRIRFILVAIKGCVGDEPKDPDYDENGDNDIADYDLHFITFPFNSNAFVIEVT